MPLSIQPFSSIHVSAERSSSSAFMKACDFCSSTYCSTLCSPMISGDEFLRLRVYFFGLTTSTEQCARAETAEETLPSNKRSIPLVPLAPTKMQSAPQVCASSRSSSAGLPRLINTSACNPALRSLCAAGSKISLTWFQLLSSATSIHFIVDGCEGLEVSGIKVSTTANRATSVPLGH